MEKIRGFEIAKGFEDKGYKVEDIINKLTTEMLKHAAAMEFERAAELRDKIKELEQYK